MEHTPPQEAETETVNKIPSTIQFEHSFFHTLEHTSFRTLEDTHEPVMVTVLDRHEVSLKFSGIKSELNLTPDDPDAKMLDHIREGLKYVRELHIGDKMPTEMTTGGASVGSHGPAPRHGS
ncbi:hypothetical protein [Magnetovibrio blakemorei]|uniref:hypothetical protein n=1 Tax=Magnetovibrio blakemorei TaxID=28181 RepID=UPI000A077052|nr:hypothetical protein [Magnetovibrio blakemorei]